MSGISNSIGVFLNDAVDDVEFFAGIDNNAKGGNWSPDKEPNFELEDKPEGNEAPSGHEGHSVHASSRENDLDKAVVMEAEDDASHRENPEINFAKELEQVDPNHDSKEGSAVPEGPQNNAPVEVVEEAKTSAQPPDTNAEILSENTRAAHATEDNKRAEKSTKKVIESTSQKALNPKNENATNEQEEICTFEKEEANAKCCIECNLI